jgi:peptidoglycan/xylan/chitin deacetylase (PgdA/CDA1 family)
MFGRHFSRTTAILLHIHRGTGLVHWYNLSRNMLSNEALPLSIPSGTICLTFDDGPGKHTLEIAACLAELNMQATFFVVGQHVRYDLETVRKVRALGHWIGNHTDTHPQLNRLMASGGDITREVLGTDRLIVEFVGSGPFLFRPPYGQWDSKVASTLNQDVDLKKYLGPIMWDIEVCDCGIGERRDGTLWTLEMCQQAYLERIESAGKGVVLLHDSAADPGDRGAKLRANNRTHELVRWLAPKIRNNFKCVGINSIIQ